MSIFAEILDRLLDDQETDEESHLCGQFGKGRDKKARKAVQIDKEPLYVIRAFGTNRLKN